MQDTGVLTTVEPTIRAANNTADSLVPYTENEAKNKLQNFIKNNFAMKVKINQIKHSELLLLFTHQNGAKYFLKAEYHNNDEAMTIYMRENKHNFSFLKM